MYTGINLGPALAGFVLSLLVALLLITPLFWRWRGSLTRTRIGILIALISTFLLLCPFSQPLILEPLDTSLNYRFLDRAIQAGLVEGMTHDQVAAILGKPDSRENFPPSYIVDRQGKREQAGEAYERWCFYPLPFYWVGSKFEISFNAAGRVRSFEANDD